jgi:L-glyceraldehyde 3-phosphate reductase
MEVCHAEGIGIMAYMPLAQGLLTDRYAGGIPVDSRVAAGRTSLKTADVNEELSAKVTALRRIALDRGQSLAQMAIAWTLRDDRVTSALIGASRPEQIIENSKAVENTVFSPDELAAIDRILTSPETR